MAIPQMQWSDKWWGANPMKRVFDILLALIGLIVTAPIIIGITIAILWRDGGPVFYVAERMKTPDQAFNLIKFRTMSNVPHD
jgi:lipopolysaccharide/colanic/teichoic acid biosynthesis glycosyltransferase